MINIILAELTAYNISTTNTETIRLGSHGYNHPSAPGYYEPRLIQPLRFRRDMFSGNRTGGPTRLSFGDMRIANSDGGLDYLKDNYAVAGRKIDLKIGLGDDVYSSFELIISGVVQQIIFGLNEITIQLRDRLKDLETPVQLKKFQGNNILPNGLEGGDNLTDVVKPLVFGFAGNISPPQVNSSRLIYQVSSGLIHDVSGVFDNGANLTKGSDYLSLGGMEANAPNPGHYRVWKSSAGSYFRLGTSPVGTVTCDVSEKLLSADTTAAQVAKRVATQEGGIQESDFNAADVTALDAATSGMGVGVWINSEMDIGAVMDLILISVGAWYGFDRLGKLRMQRLEAPGATPTAVFKRMGLGTPQAATNEFNIIALRFAESNDPDQGVPNWEVNVEWGRNYTVQDESSLAGVVSQARREYLIRAIRTETRSDESIKTVWPLAESRTVLTQFSAKTSAESEAGRLLNLFKVRRDFLELDVRMEKSLISLIELGNTVRVIFPRYGFDSGKNFRITGMQYDSEKMLMTLALWG